MTEHTLVRPAGTSWASVVGGWLAAIGAAALVAPAVAAVLAGRPVVPNDLALAVPVVLGLMIAYLIGGYVAGRMAGYTTSWHGMMTAFFGLFVALVALLLAAAADQGLLAASGVRSLSDVFPGIRQLDVQTLGDTLTFGAILGFLATIFAGWLGGLLAPDRYVIPVTATAIPASAAREVVVEERRERPRFRLLPALGRKGGERVERVEEEVHETRVDER
jgi:MFS family permease